LISFNAQIHASVLKCSLDVSRDEIYVCLRKDSIAKDSAAVVHLFKLYCLMVTWCFIAFTCENERCLERYTYVTCINGFSTIDTQIATFYQNSQVNQLTETYPVISYIHLTTTYRTNILKEGCDISDKT